MSTTHKLVALFAFGLIHRVVQLFLLAAAVNRQAALNPTWLSMQFLPTDLLREHFAAAILYLQQTPPLPNLIVGILSRESISPELRALALIAVAGALTCLAGVLLAALLLRLRVWPVAAFATALLFVSSGDLIVMEYTAFGQCFYEQLAMVECLIAALAAVSLARHPSPSAAVWLGLAVALLALSRATFSYFVIPAAVWLLWFRLRPKVLLAFVLPVMLLHGGWAAKQRLVQGDWLWSTSTWGGANVQNGDVKREGGRFASWRAEVDVPCAKRWQDELVIAIFNYPAFYPVPPPGAETAVPISVDRGPSPAARVIDRIAYQARQRWLPLDSAGFRELSGCVQQSYFRYWLRHPDRAIGGWLKSYVMFWNPIASYTRVLPTVLVSIRPRAAMTAKSPIWRVLINLVWVPRYFIREQALPAFITGPSLRLRAVDVIALPIAPQLVTLLAFAMLHGLPLLAAGIGIRHGFRKEVFPAGFSFLLLLYLYAAGISNLGEHGENMRFRLAVEPIIWAIGVTAVCAVMTALRGSRSQSGSGEPPPSHRADLGGILRPRRGPWRGGRCQKDTDLSAPC